MGSGFIIGPYLAVTARHVIEGFVQEYYGKTAELPYGMLLSPNLGRFSLYVFHGGDDQLIDKIFEVDQVSLSDFSDFAVLRLKPTFDDRRETGFVWRPLRMHALPVPEGYPVWGMGYVVNYAEHPETKEMAYDVNFRNAKGIVKKVYDRTRGSTMDNPCFETNAPYQGGMSGGPIFDEYGLVCGSIASSMLPTVYDEPGTEPWSHATSMWPLLGNTIEYCIPASVIPRLFSIAELNELRIISIKGAERFSLTYSNTGIVSSIKSKTFDNLNG